MAIRKSNPCKSSHGSSSQTSPLDVFNITRFNSLENFKEKFGVNESLRLMN